MRSESVANGGLCRPDSVEEDFIRQIEYRDPIAKASIWLHKQFIKIIRCIECDKEWYDGKTAEVPETLLSAMFEPTQNTLCDRFRYYSDQLALYAPGQVPTDILDTDYRCVRSLIARLYWCCRDAALIHRLKRAVEELRSQLTNEDRFASKTYKENLKKCVDEIVRVFGSLSEYFAVVEDGILHPAAKASVAEETLEIVKETREAVKETQKAVARMDERDKRGRRNSRMTFDIDTQERVYAIWKREERNPAARQLAANGRRVSHANVFTIAARELKALGIFSVERFTACLGARSDRLYRAAVSRLARQAVK